MNDMIHVQLPSGGVAMVKSTVSDETLRALDQMMRAIQRNYETLENDEQAGRAHQAHSTERTVG